MRTRLMNAHSNPERNRLNYNGMYDVLVQSTLLEKTKYSMWAGFYTYFAGCLVYAALTVGITGGITDSIKRANGLKDWQI